MIGKRKLSNQEKFEIAMDLLSGNLSHKEVCVKYKISSDYAYTLKDKGLELMKRGGASSSSVNERVIQARKITRAQRTKRIQARKKTPNSNPAQSFFSFLPLLHANKNGSEPAFKSAKILVSY